MSCLGIISVHRELLEQKRAETTNLFTIAHFWRFYFLSSLKSNIANLESENELLRNKATVVKEIATPERVLPQVKVHCPFFFGVGRAVGVVKALHCFNLPSVGEVTWLFEAILLKWCSVLLMDIKRRKNIKQQKYHLLSQINFNRYQLIDTNLFYFQNNEFIFFFRNQDLLSQS